MMNKTIRILRAPVLQACCRRGAGIQRTAMLLLATLLLTMTAQTAWADTWPEYITDVVLAGGTESEAASVKNSSTYSGYTWCSTSLNDGTSGDVIYIGYKKGSRANVNGGYITDFIVVETGSSHNPSSTFSLNGKTYYLCPTAGGNYFANQNHGNLTSQASGGWNMYLYYTKANFDDKRAVDGITIYSVNNKSDHRSGAINCYNTNGTLKEENISLNRGVSNTPYVYMHISTVTKTNRPSVDPVMASGLTYNGSAKQLIATGATLASGTMYYRLGTSGSFTSTMADVKATTAGTHTVYYYAGANSYSNQSDTHSATVSIAKSPNNGVTVSCADIVDGNAPAPQLGGTNLSTGAVTYQYSTTQNGTYTTTVPTDFGKYWVKATIAGDDNCNAFTTAAASFWILADANDLWNIKGGANGTVDHPIVISTPSQFDLLAKKVNGTDGYTANDYIGKYFELGANITYDGTENNYTPIGTESNAFSGHFDGKGHTVSGININKNTESYKGLFGRIVSAEVKNLTLDNSRIVGRDYCGGISGYNYKGTISNCHVTSSVTIHGSYAYARYHGGITGYNNLSSIIGCTSGADVTAASNVNNTEQYGGIAGYTTSGTIEDCLVYGGSITSSNKAGTVVGKYFSGTLTNNHYSGVTLNGSEAGVDKGVGDGSQDGTSYICAIIPYEGVTLSIPSVSATTEYPYDGLKIYPTRMTYKGQYYNYIANADAGISGDVTFTATYSGSVPEDYALSGFGYTSLADATDVSTEWAATDGSATCMLCTDQAHTYYIAPSFLFIVWGGGDGSQENPYIIKTVRGMNKLATDVNSGEGNLGGKYFELGADITYDGTENNYTTIGTISHQFSANFDGKGHTISGININTGSNCQGIFGCAADCTIQNLTLANSTITTGGNSGGIFGQGQGVIVSNCHVANTVTMHANGTMFGGIGGYARKSSTIEGCTSAAKLSFDSDYANGGIMGGTYVSTIKDCLYLGPKFDTTENGAILGSEGYGSTITNCYHTVYGMGAVEGSDRDGARFAIATGTKPSTFGDATATYGTGTYTGITAYGTNGLEYDGKYYWHDENLMELADHNEDNSSVIVANEGQTCNVVLKDRTLYKDGSWNTLCLPFAVSSEQLNESSNPLNGSTIKALDAANSNLSSDGTLTLTFTEATSIEAGKPYIVKWTSGEGTVSNPVFEGVTITATAPTAVEFTNNATAGYCQFVGQFSPFTIVESGATVDNEGNRNEIILMGAGSKLGYAASVPKTLRSFRAHFMVPADGTTGAPVNGFMLDFGDGDNATGIISVSKDSGIDGVADGWYSLDGRKLDGQPARKGVFIHGGRKVVVSR